MWKQQIGHAIGLFKMRIPGENKGFNSEVGILLHSYRYDRWIANQRGSSASSHQAHTRPEIGANFKFFAAAAMQLRHAALAFRVEARECFLRSGDGVVVDVANQIVGCGPGFLLGLANDDMQANAESDGAALFLGQTSNSRNFFFNGLRRLSPGE